MTKPRKLLMISLFGALLAGCGSDGLDDLREYVKNEHADRKPRVEPLPTVVSFEVYSYSAENLPDPFLLSNLKPQTAKAAGPRPDLNRRKEPLEDFPLDALKMRGTITRGKTVEAIIVAPDGTVHRVKKGQHAGQNFGMITRISEEKIDLVELIPGALGEWVEREASLAIQE